MTTRTGSGWRYQRGDAMTKPYWPIEIERRFEHARVQPDKAAQSEELAQQVAEYLARGGEIESVPSGVSGERPVVITRRNLSG